MNITEKLAKDITEFFEAHPQLLFFVADPDSDTVIAGHNSRMVARRILNPKGEASNEVKDALNIKVGKRARGQLTMKFASFIDNLARDAADQKVISSIKSKGRKRQLVTT